MVLFCWGVSYIKVWHEVRDPIHSFVKLSNDERLVLDSLEFQRLRYINQLALSYLLYPGARHSRFEHSLGVMELANKIYWILVNKNNCGKVMDRFIQLKDLEQLNY